MSDRKRGEEGERGREVGRGNGGRRERRAEEGRGGDGMGGGVWPQLQLLDSPVHRGTRCRHSVFL